MFYIGQSKRCFNITNLKMCSRICSIGICFILDSLKRCFRIIDSKSFSNYEFQNVFDLILRLKIGLCVLKYLI